MMGCKDKNSAPELLYKQHYYGSTEAATIVGMYVLGVNGRVVGKTRFFLLLYILVLGILLIQINQL